MSPFKITELTCISFSGGRTSAYMLYRVLEENGGLPEEAVVCFANTGKEDERTLEFVERCSSEWMIPIVWLEYTSSGNKFKTVNFHTASRGGEPFSELVVKRSFLPNSVMRFCTSELKILTIERYFKSIGIEEFQTMVGIRADEPKRVVKMRDQKLMPLAMAGVTQADVQNFWKLNSFDLGLGFNDGVTAFGNCDLCFMKPMHQLMSMIADNPDRAIWWAKQEEMIGGKFSKDRPGYSEMMKFSREQMDMFDKSEEAIACFCGD